MANGEYVGIEQAQREIRRAYINKENYVLFTVPNIVDEWYKKSILDYASKFNYKNAVIWHHKYTMDIFVCNIRNK